MKAIEARLPCEILIPTEKKNWVEPLKVTEYLKIAHIFLKVLFGRQKKTVSELSFIKKIIEKEWKLMNEWRHDVLIESLVMTRNKFLSAVFSKWIFGLLGTL